MEVNEFAVRINCVVRPMVHKCGRLGEYSVIDNVLLHIGA